MLRRSVYEYIGQGALRAFLSAWLLIGAGCAGVPVDSDADEIPGVSGGFGFPDEADPIMASLPFVEDELIVQHFPGADQESMQAAFAEADATVISELPELDVTTLRIRAGTQETVAGQLAATDLFESFHKNYVVSVGAVPNDPSYSSQPHLAQIRAPQAWDVSVGAREVILAIVDSGVEANHPDLRGRISGGWNVRTNTADYRDGKGHGTLVAGVAAAATNNAVGVSGVTWDCPILAVRVSDDSGQATARDVTAGILWSVNNGARVINVSFAPLWSNSLVKSATELAFNRGGIVVISAGNGGSVQTAEGYEQALFVGAVDSSNRIAEFSDRGPFVDLVAPGKGIYSTAIGSTYRTADGTSFAAPIVSGVAALAWSKNPALRPSTIQTLLTSTATDLGTAGYDSTFAGGLVNAATAVEAASAIVESPDGTPPSVQISSPRNGSTLQGKARIQVTASDAGGVADVVLLVDGVPWATDNRSPYQFLLDTNTFSSGNHTLLVRATDVAGNKAERSITATFGQANGFGGASIAFRAPAADATVTGNVLIEATVSDTDGMAAIEWWINGVAVQTTALTGTTSGVSYLWRGSGVPAGVYTITLQVIDIRGNRQSGNLTVTRR